MKSLLIASIALFSILAQANNQQCEKLAVSSVKSAYSGMFKADEDGYKRFINLVVCKPVNTSKFCVVGTTTNERGEDARFEVVLNSECTAVTKVKLLVTQDN